MIFAGITKSSLLDYPGKISIVLYTPGCNFNCFYCHNRLIIEDIDHIIPRKEIDDLLEKRLGLIDSVVITGGEPTLHFDLIPFLKKVKSMGYLTKLDSNGSNPEIIQKCIDENAVDYYAIDYKAPISKYEEIARSEANPRNVLNTIRLLIEHQKEFEVRTTVIPQLNLEDLIQMAKELPPLPRYVLNPYRTPEVYLESDQELIDVPPYSENTIAEFAKTVKLYQPNVYLPF
ncbi:MAG: anaerobic ribonucleoside-triphosphate reductase activating protein [Bacilli bacterium]|nr:anaerobic ribonucleoside-triphosphate reductase activating protein [Bacilli bacterium]MBN2876941.1 anaerobic ribonucleoside-triphosphate reductase activating protein [Bacilli bacterium]